MSTPRKHHYLPQFYLEVFKIHPQKGKKPHIWQIEKEGEQKSYSPAVEDTGCMRDYHSIDHNDQEPDHKSVESMLSQIALCFLPQVIYGVMSIKGKFSAIEYD